MALRDRASQERQTPVLEASQEGPGLQDRRFWREKEEGRAPEQTWCPLERRLLAEEEGGW